MKKIKIISIKILAGILNGLVYLKKYSPKIFKIMAHPFKTLGRILLLIAVLPFYRFYLTGKKLATKFYAPRQSRHWLIHPFSRRYLTHATIIIISFFVVVANMNAYETRQLDYGQTGIAANLYTTEDLGAIAEEGPIPSGARISHYLGQAGVSVQPQIGIDDESQQTVPRTVSGGSALVGPILSPTEEQLRQRDEIIIYTVQIGDTISEIAEKFGISINTILWENNLTGYSLIQPSSKLTILPVSGIRYKVAKSDSLAKIAKQYGVDEQTIIDFNKLSSAENIRVGESLMIPGGKKIIAAPTPRYAVRSLAQPVSTTRVVSTGRMVWPNGCYRITQYFGWRHSGLDIACPYGTPIHAADSGRIIKAQGGYNGGYGNMTIIDHGNGIQSLYGHQSAIYVDVGEYVTKGQVIGAEGSTGRSTGPHLHFEVRVGGSRRNPLSYIR